MKKRILNRIMILLSLVLLFFFLVLRYIPENDPGSLDSNNESPIKLAAAIYDAPYTDGDYRWLADHFDLVIAQEADQENMKKLKSYNPEMMVLLYKFAGITDENKIGHSASGFTRIAKIHPDWFLKTEEGKHVYDDYSDFSRMHSFFLDYGNNAWTEYAAEDYLRSLQSGPWDGIFLDVIYFDTDQYMPQRLDYDAQAYEVAVQKHLQGLSQRLSKEGKLLVINGASLLNHEPFDRWAGTEIENIFREAYKVSDGIAEEAFSSLAHWRPDIVWQDPIRWERQINALETAGRKEKYYLALAHNRGLNEQDAVYNLASFLLGMRPGRAFYHGGGVRGYRLKSYRQDFEAFRSLYTIPLGNPIGERMLENGLWTREFANGKVYANPFPFTRSIKLAHAYTDYLTGKKMQRFSLGPNQGMLLLAS